MLKKIAIVSLLLLLIGWTGFAIYSITDNTQELAYLAYFNVDDDESVIAIHHPSDFQWDELKVDCNQKNIEVLASLIPKIDDFKSAFLSKKRGLLVIETYEKWTINRIKKTFEHGIYSFKLNNPNSFQFGRFLGKFKGNDLLLYYYDLDLNSSDSLETWGIDFQSSYSIILLRKGQKAVTKDVYIKPNEQITYTSTPFIHSKQPLVDDLLLFGNFIPSDTKEYEFNAKHYLMATDQQFKKSPIKSLMKTGAILIKRNQTPIFVFDLNQDVSLTAFLNDYYHFSEENKDRSRYKHFPICQSMSDQINVKGQVIKDIEYLAYSTDGYGFITTDESALDAILLELEMKKSVNTNLENHKLFKESLPKKVSQRLLSENKCSSISWINNRLFETAIDHAGTEKLGDQLEDSKNYFTMNPGSPVVSFCALSGRGNVIVETENELIGYKNGSLKWRKPLNQALANRPVALNTSNLENEFIIIPYDDHLEIIDKMGRDQYKINGVFDEQVVQCSINQQAAFGITSKNGITFYSSNNGKQLKRFTVNEPILHWTVFNQGAKVSLGLHTEKSIIKIEYGSGKKQTLSNKPTEFVAFTGLGVLMRGPKGMQELIGNKVIDVQVPSYWKFVGEVANNQNTGQLFHDGKSIAYVIKGKVQWKKAVDCSEISEVVQLKNSNSLFAVRDALENKIYIFDYSGQLLDQEERPAQRTMQLTPFVGHGCSITTYLNDFVIQFNY